MALERTIAILISYRNAIGNARKAFPVFSQRVCSLSRATNNRSRSPTNRSEPDISNAPANNLAADWQGAAN